MLRRLGVAKENDRLPYLRKMFHFGLLRRFLEDEGREQGAGNREKNMVGLNRKDKVKQDH